MNSSPTKLITTEKRRRGPSSVLALIFLTGSLGFLWFATQDEDDVESTHISSELHEQSVNRHLRQTTREIEKRELTARIENLKSAPPLDETKAVKAYEASSLSVEFKPDPRLNELSETLREKKRPPEAVADPNQTIQAQLLDRQKWNEYDLAYRQAYAEKFVENARKGGWDIKLSDDFKVIKARPIKKDNRPELFPEIPDDHRRRPN